MSKTQRRFKGVAFKQTEADKREKTVTAIVTAPTLDRDGEVVDTASILVPLAGGQLIEAGKLTGTEAVDIPFQIDHDASVMSTIGSARSARYTESGELEITFGVSKRELAQEMFILLEEGHLKNAFSITYLYDWDNIEDGVAKGVELIEVSLVYRGSNRNARTIAVSKSFAERIDEMDKEERVKQAKSALEAAQAELDAAEAAAKSDGDSNEEQPEETENEEGEVETTTAENTPGDEEQPESEQLEEEKEEETVNKTVKAQATKAAAPATEKNTTDAQFDKVEHAAKQFKAFLQGKHADLVKLNEEAQKTYKMKSSKDLKSKDPVGALQTATPAAGGAIVPSAPLMSDVFSVLGTYSTIAKDLTVVTLEEGNSIDFASLVVDVVMKEVEDEGGDKAVTKLEFAKGNIAVREMAGIAIITKKLIRQASTNIYNTLVESFARAIARKRAAMALTDSKSGLYKITNVVELETEADLPTWVELKKMPYKIPAEAVQGGKYYISRELLESLDTTTDKQGRDMDIVKLSGDGLTGLFKNGYEFSVEDQLGENKEHAVFGAVGRFGRIIRQGIVESETFMTGSVTDDSTEHNMLQQNKVAHRVAFYENVGYPIPGAFVRTVNKS